MKKYLAAIFFLSLIACESEGDKPSIILSEVTYISVRVAAATGNITFAGSSEIKQYGICYNTEDQPTINDSHTVNSSWLGIFTDTLVNLKPATDYKIRAYAINDEGIDYSDELSLMTRGGSPSIINPRVKANHPPLAIIRAWIQPNKVVTNAYFEYGLTANYELGKTDIHYNINKNAEITAELNGLIPLQEYHFRVVAENEAGTKFSEDISFTSRLMIGDEYNEGIVAYVDQTGIHGFVSRTTYLCCTGPYGLAHMSYWGPSPFQFHNATGCGINDGKANTIKIMADNVGSGNFVSVIYNTVRGENNDWYMPSKEELAVVREQIYLNGLGAFPGIEYWSSSEVNIDSVWTQNFSTGEQFKRIKKSEEEYVSVAISYF